MALLKIIQDHLLWFKVFIKQGDYYSWDHCTKPWSVLDIGQKPLSFVISYESVKLKKKKKKPILFCYSCSILDTWKIEFYMLQSKGRITEEFSFSIAYATKDLENQEENRQKCSACSCAHLRFPKVAWLTGLGECLNIASLLTLNIA